MGKLLVCQHVAYEPLGTLHALIKQSGHRIKYVNFDRTPNTRPQLNGYDALIILGGPMGVNDADRYPFLRVETALIRDAIAREIPVLGICLGAQLIAAALGAAVTRNPCREIGWYEVALTAAGQRDPLLAHCAATEQIFQWHQDTFALPTGAIHLASTPTCANQAFRVGRNVYGFQFHLEVDESMIRRWLHLPDHLAAIHELDRISPDEIRQQTPQHIDRLKQLSASTFGAFLALIGPVRERVVLPSR